MDDSKQPEPHVMTAADVAEAAARAGLRDGVWGSLSVDKHGASVRPPEQRAVRSAVEHGEIGWVDAYLESDAAIQGRIDPDVLLPAAKTPPPNRAQRRERANKIHPSRRGQRGGKAKRR